MGLAVRLVPFFYSCLSLLKGNVVKNNLRFIFKSKKKGTELPQSLF